MRKGKDLDMDAINLYCLGTLGIVIISAIFTAFRAYIFSIMSEKIAKALRYDLVYFLINKDVGFFDENKTGDILSRISSDTEVV